MTGNEDLIARLRNHSGVQTAGVNERVRLMDEAADTLEKVSAERDVLSSLREQMSLRLRCVVGKREQAEAERDEALKEADRSAQERGRLIEERDQLAAVIREALGVARSGSVPLGVQEARHFDRLLAETRRALNEAPSVALDRVRAEALREAAGRLPVDCYDPRHVADLLRERADRIERGESDDQ